MDLQVHKRTGKQTAVKDRKKTGRPIPPEVGFESRFLDFSRGIRVGHLEPRQRITQLLKNALQDLFGQSFVVDRFGRGVFWQWICFVPKANRVQKPLSPHLNFSSSKFFIMVDRHSAVFKAGLQVERGFLQPPQKWKTCVLQEDWDWHRLLKGISEGPLFKEVRRLCRSEGFRVFAGNDSRPCHFEARNLQSPDDLVSALTTVPGRDWSGFQLYYPMTEQEVRQSSGPDLVEAMVAIFLEVTPAMNQCMDIDIRVRLPQ